MKRFLCFVCGRKVVLKNARQVYGLTCTPCFELLAVIPPKAQKLLSFIFRRLERLEKPENRHVHI